MNRQMKRMTKRESKKAMKVMNAEIQEILNNFDFSNYEITIGINDITRHVYVPKPVFVLSLIDENVDAWMTTTVNQHPGYVVAVV